MKSFYETFLVETNNGLKYTEQKRLHYKKSMLCSCFKKIGGRDKINLFNYDRNQFPLYNELTICGHYINGYIKMRDIDLVIIIKLELYITYEEI